MGQLPEPVIDPRATWQSFLTEPQDEILPIYLRHEQIFESWSIHGRMHICRCVLFAEIMSRYYFRHTTRQFSTGRRIFRRSTYFNTAESVHTSDIQELAD